MPSMQQNNETRANNLARCSCVSRACSRRRIRSGHGSLKLADDSLTAFGQSQKDLPRPRVRMNAGNEQHWTLRPYNSPQAEQDLLLLLRESLFHQQVSWSHTCAFPGLIKLLVAVDLENQLQIKLPKHSKSMRKIQKACCIPLPCTSTIKKGPCGLDRLDCLMFGASKSAQQQNVDNYQHAAWGVAQQSPYNMSVKVDPLWFLQQRTTQRRMSMQLRWSLPSNFVLLVCRSGYTWCMDTVEQLHLE